MSSGELPNLWLREDAQLGDAQWGEKTIFIVADHLGCGPLLYSIYACKVGAVVFSSDKVLKPVLRLGNEFGGGMCFVSLGSLLYLIGALDEGGQERDVYALDLEMIPDDADPLKSVDLLKKLTPMSAPKVYPKALVVRGNIYVLPGRFTPDLDYDCDTFTTFEVFSTLENSWSSFPVPLPPDHYCEGAYVVESYTVCADRYIIVGLRDAIFKFDVLFSKWTSIDIAPKIFTKQIFADEKLYHGCSVGFVKPITEVGSCDYFMDPVAAHLIDVSVYNLSGFMKYCHSYGVIPLDHKKLVVVLIGQDFDPYEDKEEQKCNKAKVSLSVFQFKVVEEVKVVEVVASTTHVIDHPNPPEWVSLDHCFTAS